MNGICTYDFSLDKNRVLGGSMGYKEIAPGIWGMAAGDSNGDGNINDTDRQNNWNATAGIRGYTLFDFSMDSQLDNKDKNELWYPNLEFHSQVPY